MAYPTSQITKCSGGTTAPPLPSPQESGCAIATKTQCEDAFLRQRLCACLIGSCFRWPGVDWKWLLRCGHTMQHCAQHVNCTVKRGATNNLSAIFYSSWQELAQWYLDPGGLISLQPIRGFHSTQTAAITIAWGLRPSGKNSNNTLWIKV